MMRMETTTIQRSPNCLIIVSADSLPNQCQECLKFEREKNSWFNIRDSIEVDEETHNAISGICDMEKGKMNQFLRQLYLDNQQNASRDVTSRRYHPDVLRWCIELYCRSPAAYSHIRSSEVLTLPSPRTIRSYRNCIPPNPGINPLAISQIEQAKKNGDNMVGYMCIDEMSIRENLVLHDGALVGLVDPETVTTGDRANELATHILAFYVRTVTRQVSIPLAWYATRSIPASRLSSLVWRAVISCENAGMQIHALVADAHPTNRKMFRILSTGHRIDLDQCLVAHNPLAPSRPIYLLSDSPHLLKTARNSLYSSRPGGAKYLCNSSGQNILWSHISDQYQKECSSLLSETGLTKAHVELTSYSKMKVNLAAGILNERVGKVLSRVEGAEGTANFILKLAKWFSIVNCNPRNAIKSINDERIAWLEEFACELQQWQDHVRLLHPGETKRIVATPTLEGLCFSSRNLAALTRRLLSTNALQYVCLCSFTQDVLEAFFGNVRQHGGRSSNPDVREVAITIQHLAVRKTIKKVRGSNTTFGSKNAWEQICDEPLPKRKKNEN